ncbi:DsbA family protein [Paenibacillus sp. GYB004]
MILLVVLTKMADKPQTQTFEDRPPIENQPTIGKKDAKVSIVEFGDYKCPSCKAWGEQIFPRLTKDYVDTGKVSFSYINVFFHGPESKLAALAAESIYAQNPEAYWTFHKEVFNAQPKEDHDAQWVTLDKLIQIARTSTPQIDVKKMEGDMQSELMQSHIRLDENLTTQYRVEETPTIMINGTVVANPFDYDQIKSMIESKLGESK